MATVLVLAGTLVGTADAVAQANPRIFAPDTISDHRWQWRITFTPSGDTAYYAVSDGFFPAARVATIVMSARTADGWSHPVVAPFSGNHQDMDPFVTRDGTRLYFSSSRPTPADSAEERSDFDIWYV
ncbi:MAG TPA: hypothetical protein VK966_06320, partial [Longimicrobiales bacterium]|nr:hypothetical protein [Longimicrobiales bacterium]